MQKDTSQVRILHRAVYDPESKYLNHVHSASTIPMIPYIESQSPHCIGTWAMIDDSTEAPPSSSASPAGPSVATGGLSPCATAAGACAA